MFKNRRVAEIETHTETFIAVLDTTSIVGVESRVWQAEQHRFVGEQQWEHEGLENGRNGRCKTAGGERAEERKVCTWRSVGDHRAQSTEKEFEYFEKCRHQSHKVQSSNAQGKTVS